MDMLEYVSLVVVVINPNGLTFLVLFALVGARKLVVDSPEFADTVFSHVALICAWGLIRLRAHVQPAQQPFTRPPQPVVYQMGDTLEVFVRASHSDKDAHPLTLITHPTIAVCPTSAKRDTPTYITQLDLSRFQNYSVRCAWAELPWMGCHSACTRVEVSEDYPPFLCELRTVTKSRTSPTILCMEIDLRSESGEVHSLEDTINDIGCFQNRLSQREQDWLDDHSQTPTPPRFVCRFERSDGSIVPPLQRELNEDFTASTEDISGEFPLLSNLVDLHSNKFLMLRRPHDTGASRNDVVCWSRN